MNDVLQVGLYNQPGRNRCLISQLQPHFVVAYGGIGCIGDIAVAVGIASLFADPDIAEGEAKGIFITSLEYTFPVNACIELNFGHVPIWWSQHQAGKGTNAPVLCRGIVP